LVGSSGRDHQHVAFATDLECAITDIRSSLAAAMMVRPAIRTPATKGRSAAGSTWRVLFASERLAVSMCRNRSRRAWSERGVADADVIDGPSNGYVVALAPATVNTVRVTLRWSIGGCDDRTICHSNETREAVSHSRPAAVRSRPVDHLFGGGYPDATLFPLEQPRAVYTRSILDHGQACVHLSNGSRHLRFQIAGRMADEGVTAPRTTSSSCTAVSKVSISSPSCWSTRAM
jgi:hypothetical protein